MGSSPRQANQEFVVMPRSEQVRVTGAQVPLLWCLQGKIDLNSHRIRKQSIKSLKDVCKLHMSLLRVAHRILLGKSHRRLL
jgi:hypothetical protein